MGIDWEYYLGAEGEDIASAYEDAVMDTVLHEQAEIELQEPEQVVLRRVSTKLIHRMKSGKGIYFYRIYFKCPELAAGYVSFTVGEDGVRDIDSTPGDKYACNYRDVVIGCKGDMKKLSYRDSRMPGKFQHTFMNAESLAELFCKSQKIFREKLRMENTR